eukprot:216574-Lingulodinium_polyedra.AAC.1
MPPGGTARVGSAGSTAPAQAQMAQRALLGMCTCCTYRHVRVCVCTRAASPASASACKRAGPCVCAPACLSACLLACVCACESCM